MELFGPERENRIGTAEGGGNRPGIRAQAAMAF